MDKRAIVLSTLVGTGVAVVCVPEIRAYRRLSAITRSLGPAYQLETPQTESTNDCVPKK